jgi:RNA polymerase sigma factor (sigma-70 family)
VTGAVRQAVDAVDEVAGRTPAASATSLSAALWLESSYLGRAVRRVALRYGLADEDTADLVQEVRIVLLQTDPGRVLNATWIFQTATHKAADAVRLRMRAAAGELGAAADASSSAGAPSAELLHLLRANAARLPPKLRTFYDLRFGQGLSQRDVARRLGACRASVRWLERQCVRRVRRCAPLSTVAEIL